MAKAPGRHYLIRVRGQFSPEWATWFDDLSMTPEPNGDTILVGLVPDQAALHGLLARIRDLGLPLVSVQELDVGDEPPPSPPAPKAADER